MASLTMSRKVKLGDEEANVHQSAVEVVLWRKLRHAAPQVAAPLTSDVIRDYNVSELVTIFPDATEENKVHVDVSGIDL